MRDALLRTYHRLPPAARSLAATVKGLHLRVWRYGRDTERLVEAAIEREHWSQTRWRNWQEERLAFVLHRAATRVPYYRAQWQARRRRGDRASWDVLENWPILEKRELRDSPRGFLSDDCNPRWMYQEHTSGTTGTPLILWWSRATVRHWYALMEARWRRWYGVSRDDRWAILGGQLVVSGAQRRPPYWVWNAALKQLYLSSYHLAPQTVASYQEALRRYRIRYLWGYTSALHALAQVPTLPRRVSERLRVVVTNAEPLLQHQQIGRAHV